MSPRTQWAALILLGGIWAGAVFWALVPGPEQKAVPLKFVTGQTASREQGRGQTQAGLKIRVDLLEAGRKQADRAFVAPKNIFAPLRVPEPPRSAPVQAFKLPPVPLRETLARPPAPVAPSAPGPTPEELAAQAAQQEMAQFRYLGYLNRDGRSEAFLSNGKELHIVQAGEIMAQRILVKAITPTNVVLQEPRSHAEKTILLAGDAR
jgi:hypothetical protein